MDDSSVLSIEREDLLVVKTKIWPCLEGSGRIFPVRLIPNYTEPAVDPNGLFLPLRWQTVLQYRSLHKLSRGAQDVLKHGTFLLFYRIMKEDLYVVPNCNSTPAWASYSFSDLREKFEHAERYEV